MSRQVSVGYDEVASKKAVDEWGAKTSISLTDTSLINNEAGTRLKKKNLLLTHIFFDNGKMFLSAIDIMLTTVLIC